MNENLLRSETKSSAAIYYAKRLPLRSREAAECGGSILATALPFRKVSNNKERRRRSYLFCVSKIRVSVSERSERRVPFLFYAKRLPLRSRNAAECGGMGFEIESKY
ncbi:MAG: hypothetical protein LBH47_02400 [Christensenellaceae bacterium]|nr:hypothetical protein [Christensenellaceae bacterium]